MLKCTFSDVSERDMDLLFLEEFVNSQDFADIFLNEIAMPGAKVVEVEQSKVDVEFGESDITVIVEHNGKRHGLLIEDKIDAIAMPEQCARYEERGKIGIKDGDYAAFDIFIIAPERYIADNAEAKRYPHKISYEKCLDYFSKSDNNRNIFKRQQIIQAISKQKKGYTVIENERVTDSWEKYITLQQDKFPYLWLATSGGPKGSRASWPRFNTVIKGLYMYHKTEIGYIDLNFNGCSERIVELREMLTGMLGNLTEQELSIHQTGKAAVLRIFVPQINFKEPFEEYRDKVIECLNAVARMTNLVEKLDRDAVSEFLAVKR